MREWINSITLTTSRTSMVFASYLLSTTASSLSSSGDKATQRRLKRKVKEVDVHRYWADHAHLINVNAIKNTVPEKDQGITPEEKALNVIPIKPAPKMAATQEPYNPMSRLGWAKQLGESPSEFLRRVPPLTTLTSDGWIWCANPYAPRDKKPEDINEAYIGRMRQLLAAYIDKKTKIVQQNPTMAPGTITRRLLPDRERLKDEIREGAKKANMTCGKVRLHQSNVSTILIHLSGCCSQRQRSRQKSGSRWLKLSLLESSASWPRLRQSAKPVRTIV